MKMKIAFSSLLLAALAWGTPLQVSAAKKAAPNNKFAGYLFAYPAGGLFLPYIPLNCIFRLKNDKKVWWFERKNVFLRMKRDSFCRR